MFNNLVRAKRAETALEHAQERIKDLEEELRSRLMNPAPSFRQVAKSFDISAIVPQIHDQVIEDLGPMMREDAIRILRQTMQHTNQPRRSLYVDVAEENTPSHSPVYEVLAQLTEGGCRFKAFNP